MVQNNAQDIVWNGATAIRLDLLFALSNLVEQSVHIGAIKGAVRVTVPVSGLD
jgi:hypothetical protein